MINYLTFVYRPLFKMYIKIILRGQDSPPVPKYKILSPLRPTDLGVLFSCPAYESRKMKTLNSFLLYVSLGRSSLASKRSDTTAGVVQCEFSCRKRPEWLGTSVGFWWRYVLFFFFFSITALGVWPLFPLQRIPVTLCPMPSCCIFLLPYFSGPFQHRPSTYFTYSLCSSSSYCALQ
jgi:hypothetical protein